MKTRKNKNFMTIFITSLLLFLFSFQVFAEEASVIARIPVSCIGVNTAEEFQFIIIADSSEYQTVLKDTVFLKNEEMDCFETSYTYPGTYRYTVKQIIGSNDDMIYDETSYEVVVYVTSDEEGILYAQPIIFKEGDNEKLESILFINERILKGNNLDVTKNIPTGDHIFLSVIVYSLSFLISVLLITFVIYRHCGKNNRSKNKDGDL